jgi:hypothetical protein
MYLLIYFRVKGGIRIPKLITGLLIIRQSLLEGGIGSFPAQLWPLAHL